MCLRLSVQGIGAGKVRILAGQHAMSARAEAAARNCLQELQLIRQANTRNPLHFVSIEGGRDGVSEIFGVRSIVSEHVEEQDIRGIPNCVRGII